MKPETEKKVRERFRTILKVRSGSGLMDYAKTYAQAGLSLSGEALQLQIPYVLSNLGGWRGPEARVTKEFLRRAMKEDT